jgi:cyclic pyranopterin monophosphate synthase
MNGSKLSHIDESGRIRMVDVSGKPATAREAVARGHVSMSAEARAQVRGGTTRKGDAIETARLAGIMAAKQTSSLIPLCHPLPISHIDVQITPARGGYAIEARVRTTAETGVEMEALTAVSVAALTLYDMVKAIDKAMVIADVRLIEKRGGKSGLWQAKIKRSKRSKRSQRSQRSQRSKDPKIQRSKDQRNRRVKRLKGQEV